MSHIFISYSRKDIDFAGKIVQTLAGNQLDTWIDWKSIPKGEDWEQEIYHGIEEADAFLFLISPDSVASQMCNKEIAHAVKNGKRILPIFISNSDVGEVHKAFREDKSREEISRRNYIFCRDGQDDFNATIKQIRETIHTDYEWLKFQRELQVKALKWAQQRDTSHLLRGKEIREAEQQLTNINYQDDPQPTKLQKEYVLASQRNEERERRQITIGLSLGLVFMVILSVFALVQRNYAQASEKRALAEADAKATALVNEEIANVIARAEKERAEQQASIALARQLAAQGQYLFAQEEPKQTISVLLAIQSMSIFPSTEAAQILQNNTIAYPITSMTQDDIISSVAISPDSMYVASSSFDNTVHVWDATSGDEISLMKHDGRVFSIAFSPDNKYIVSGSFDRTARIWDVKSGKEVVRMKHGGWVEYVTFSSDGRYVLSESTDKSARIWDAVTGQEITQIPNDAGDKSVAFSPNDQYVVSVDEGKACVYDSLTGKEISCMFQNGALYSVGFSPDSKYVVSGSRSLMKVWEAATGQEISNITFDGEVNFVTFSPDNKYIASAGSDKTARVWNATTGQEVSRMTFNDGVYSVAFSPDGRYIVSGSNDKTARMWEVSSGKEVARSTHNGSVFDVVFAPNGEYIVSASNDNSIHLWKTLIPQEVARVTHDGPVLSVAFSPDGKSVVSGSLDATAREWSPVTGEEIARAVQKSDVVSVDYSPDSKYIVSGGCENLNSAGCFEGVAHVWEAATGKEIASMTHDNYVLVVAFSPNGKYVFSGSQDNTARIWDAFSGQEISRMTYDNLVYSAAFSPDSKYVISGSWDNTARVWDVITGKEIFRMNFEDQVNSVSFSPNGRYIAAGSDDENIRVWDFITRQEIAKMHHDGSVSSVSFSPNSEYLLAGSSDKTVRVWIAKTGEEVLRLIHDDSVNSAEFSPDGMFILTGSNDRTARIWDFSNGQEIARKTNVHHSTFSSNGKYILSGSSDNTALVWLWRAEDLIVDACFRAPRNMTDIEWRQYIGDVLPYQTICSKLPLDFVSMRATVKTILSNSSETNQIKTAIDKVTENLLTDISKQKIVLNDPTSEALRIVSAAVADQISVEIDSDQYVQANKLLEQAKNSELDLNYSATHLNIQKTLEMRIFAEAITGNIEKALQVLGQAAEMRLIIKNPNVYSNVCSQGSVRGYADKVIDYCEKAILLDPNNRFTHHSRGLARAILGNFSGAIDDFQFYIDESVKFGQGDNRNVQQCKMWIIDLKNSINPITDEVLEGLK